MMHPRRISSEAGRQQQEIIDVGGDDDVLETHSERQDMCVNNVGRTRPREHSAYHPSIDESELMNLKSVEEPGQSSLAAAVTPDLRYNRCRSLQHFSLLERRNEEGLRCSLASVDRYQYPGIEYHEAK
ncbi:MAG: hypothetical protein OXE79_01600 [Acidimicrobiaceae bacterium]|nr:hypothetical protein [Acidimicrobiaceae bacterium]MCY4280036.1 hypothetical protein [Acidimicrobiaceae bacterium]MCY4295028.1 hypothetical protein [Acidimicrobiaceae bacterium]